jgi:hypothetical protein
MEKKETEQGKWNQKIEKRGWGRDQKLQKIAVISRILYIVLVFQSIFSRTQDHLERKNEF